MENKIKHHYKLIIVLAVFIIAIGTYFYSSKIAPTHFSLTNTTYTHASIPKGFDGFKIAFISDFDLKNKEGLDYLEECITMVNSAKCDMVIFGGDLYDTTEHFDSDRVISILKSLDIHYGKFAVLGEDEIKSNTDSCIQILEKSGFEVLRNTAHYIYSNNDRIVVAGLENNGDVNSLVNEEMTSHFILSIVHQPDYFQEIQNSPSLLQLSGHSGGGFIKLPFMEGLVKLDGSRTYTSGTKRINDHTLMICNGIGLGHDQTLRFNCNPNALIITLKTSQ